MGRFEEYISYCQQYEKIYGEDRTVILYQCGKFYEVYGVDNANEKLGKVSEIASLLRIVETRQDTKITENSRKNPQMAGFNCASIDRFLDVLMENGYTVVIVDQITPPPDVTRGVTAIWSQGTYINNIGVKDNYLISIYIESEPHRASNKRYDHIGMTAINLATGKNYIHEVDSFSSDPNHAIDEAYRFIQTFSPIEIIVNSRNYYGNDLKIENDDLVQQLTESLDIGNITNRITLNSVAKDIYNPSYQEHYLHKLYPDHGFLSAIEYLSLTTLETARVSYILLLKFCEDHKADLLKNLKLPQLWSIEHNLVLDNNAICQLNLNDAQYRQSLMKQKKRSHSILSVIDYTTTAMGHRLLRERLMNPILDRQEIQSRYDKVLAMLETTSPLETRYSLITKTSNDDKITWWRCVESILNGIKDIDRLHRKIQLGLLIPAELSTLHDSYIAIDKIITKVQENPELNKLFSHETTTKFRDFLSWFNTIININEAKKYTTNDITDSFFNLGYNSEIDKISKDIRHSKKVIQILVDSMSDIVKKGSDSIKFKPSNTDDGYFLDISKPRFKTFEEGFTAINVCFESVTYQIQSFNLFVIDKRNKTNVKMTCPIIDTLYSSHLLDIEKLQVVVKRVYSEFLDSINHDYINILDDIANSVAATDLHASIGKLAELNNYCCPTLINETNKSQFSIQGMRHPIIEKIVKTHYVSHDIALGEQVDGMLLYGINQTGKSSTMKAIGISLVMAQAGFFVAAKNLKYSPYRKLMTRILGNDKMHGGLSSFAVEMAELRSILIRADEGTLILGDEICHGTETQSAISLVTASIIELAKKRSTFIFATHLHQLSEMSEIQGLSRVKQYHLTMYTDPNTNEIIYDRKLREGPGCAIYGIEVARALKVPFCVIQQATDIRKKYFGTGNEIVHSSYNREMYQEFCVICRQEDGTETKATETHHIYFQSEADSSGFIGKDSLYKNHVSNLVPLCNPHHMMIHNADTTGDKDVELIIIGYKVDGRLEYYMRKPMRTFQLRNISNLCIK